MDNKGNGKWRKRAQIVAYTLAVILFIFFVLLANSILKSFIPFSVALLNGQITITEHISVGLNNPADPVLGIVPEMLEAMKYAFYLEVIAGFGVLYNLFKSIDPETPPEIARRNAHSWKSLNSFFFLSESAAIVILLNPLVMPALSLGFIGGVMLSTIIIVIHSAFILVVGQFIEELETAMDTEMGASSPTFSSADADEASEVGVEGKWRVDDEWQGAFMWFQ